VTLDAGRGTATLLLAAEDAPGFCMVSRMDAEHSRTGSESKSDARADDRRHTTVNSRCDEKDEARSDELMRTNESTRVQDTTRVHCLRRRHPGRTESCVSRLKLTSEEWPLLSQSCTNKDQNDTNEEANYVLRDGWFDFALAGRVLVYHRSAR
jgi:hypothetical protein